MGTLTTGRRIQVAVGVIAIALALLLTQRHVITVRNLAPTDVVVHLSLGDEQVEMMVPAGTRRSAAVFEMVREGSLEIGIDDAAGKRQRMRCGYETVLMPHDFLVLLDGQDPRVAHCEPTNEISGWLH